MTRGVNHHEILGLPCGSHSEEIIRARFALRRDAALARLDLGGLERGEALRELEDLYLAMRALLNCERAGVRAASDPTSELCEIIEHSLEDGLLRHSCRKRILALGRELGFSEFHVQLLIAQVQFGPAESYVLTSQIERKKQTAERRPQSHAREWVLAGALALAMFGFVVGWIGG